MAQIGIFGAGYVGLVTGACFAELGHAVKIRDVVPEKIEALRRAEVPIHEPGLEELLERNSDRLDFTLDVLEAVAGADFLFICVGTPPTYSGDADLSAVWTVIDELQSVGPAKAVVVMKSTVPVGTGEKVRAALDARGLEGVGYASNPEFTAEGTAVRDFMRPDRIVVGSFEDADGDAVAALHAGIDAQVVRMDVPSAEMVKLASNAFLMTRISFINEIANVCEATGADVVKVAEAVGLDRRLGPHFLRAGIGYGGSCLAGHETVLVREAGLTRLTTLEELFDHFAERSTPDAAAVEPPEVEVLSWRSGRPGPEFLPVAAATRRPFAGEVLEVGTKMGRRVVCTPDHPFVVSAAGGETEIKLAKELSTSDWLPIARGSTGLVEADAYRLDVLADLSAAEVRVADVIVRTPGRTLARIGPATVRTGIEALGHPRGAVARSHDIVRSGALRLHEAEALGLEVEDATVGTARNGTYVPVSIPIDEPFWRVVGLYGAEGHLSVDGRRHRLQWSFHPSDETVLVEEVARFWAGLGVKASVRQGTTSMSVSVSSRLLADWWVGTLGLGSSCYDQRVPDLLWSRSTDEKRAFLAGLWHGDGSWSYVAGGPSVVLEYGTVSRELADGMLRLLGELDIVARLKVGRTAKSKVDTYWLVISGADQVERLLDLVSVPDRTLIETALARQRKRIAPTGYRRDTAGNTAWVRVDEIRRRSFANHVYSLEVPESETFVTTAGLVVHNCFPKDSLALKQLAANSGYHFQLLNAVIEVNELQKRRVIAKLEKHLGKLRGKRVALLGLAFKPHTDDMREAPSLVLASRLLAEGAEVRCWDPVADATGLLKGFVRCETPLEAVAGADAAVVVTEWPELGELDLVALRDAMRTPLLVDGRNFLDLDAAQAAGLVYEGIGRASQSSFAALPETSEPTAPDLQR